MDKPFFNIPQIITQVDRDNRAADKTVEAMLLRLETAMDWGIFAEEYQPISEILSQCDVIIAHKITAVEDMQALNKLNQDYMKRELQSMIRQINERGIAILSVTERYFRFSSPRKITTCLSSGASGNAALYAPRSVV